MKTLSFSTLIDFGNGKLEIIKKIDRIFLKCEIGIFCAIYTNQQESESRNLQRRTFRPRTVGHQFAETFEVVFGFERLAELLQRSAEVVMHVGVVGVVQ